jgi:hypothetical protein
MNNYDDDTDDCDRYYDHNDGDDDDDCRYQMLGLR